MKKYFLILGVFLGLINLNAQTEGDIEIGIGGGRTTTFFNFGDESSNMSSFNLNVQGEYYLFDNIGIKSKIIYNDLNTNRYDLSYLTVPLMFNVYLNKNNNLYIGGGYYLSFLLNSKDAETGLDKKEDLKNVDAGFNINAGYKFKIKDNFRAFVEVESQINNTDMAKSGTLPKISNLRLNTNVGISYILKE